MLQLTRATATLNVPYPPQEVCARLAAAEEHFRRHNLTCTATEQEIRLESRRIMLGYATFPGYMDSYVPIGYGKITTVERATRIDMEFKPGAPGILLLAAVLFLGIGATALALGHMLRGDAESAGDFAIGLPIAMLGLLFLGGDLHKCKNDMMFLLAQALGVET